MTLASAQNTLVQEGQRYASGSRTGTRTAGNFTINLGFAPKVIRVINLTDRVDATFFVDAALDGGSNAKGLLQVDAGTTTYEAVGIALTASGRGFTVTVATVGLETNDDEVVWMAWG